jgi:hypothetical protein
LAALPQSLAPFLSLELQPSVPNVDIEKSTSSPVSPLEPR